MVEYANLVCEKRWRSDESCCRPKRGGRLDAGGARSICRLPAVIRLRRSPEHSEELGRRLDDRSPGNWLSLQELKQRLQQGKKLS